MTTAPLLQPDLERMVADLGALVRCESPTNDPDAIRASAAVVAEVGASHLGAAPELLEAGDWVHLRWTFPGQPRVLLLGHHDTVWPLGSLDRHPWEVTGGRARGPGCFDMKAGLVQMFHALGSLTSRTGVTVLVTGDEEIGSASSRPLIEEEARRAGAALVLEAAAPGGALKTGRRGAGLYELRVEGRAAHAGLEPHVGANSGTQLAHHLLAVQQFAAELEDATLTPTRISAGTTTNTVPAAASAFLDARFATAAAGDRIDRELQTLVQSSPEVPGTRTDVTLHERRPPLEPSASDGLFALASEIAAELGMGALSAAVVGGASDGNLTAGVGTPTLDGLGAVGGGAHADDEHVVVDEMPRRTALLAHLVSALTGVASA